MGGGGGGGAGGGKEISWYSVGAGEGNKTKEKRKKKKKGGGGGGGGEVLTRFPLPSSVKGFCSPRVINVFHADADSLMFVQAQCAVALENSKHWQL